MDTFDGHAKHDFEEFHVQLKAIFAGRHYDPAVMSDDRDPWDKLSNLLYYMPDLYLLAVRLTFDDDCEAYKKGELYGAVKYVIYPMDMIPDAIPNAGWVDDMVVAGVALYNFLKMGEAEKSLVRRHWDGDTDPVAFVTQLVEVAAQAVEYLPTKLMNRVTAALNTGFEG